MSTVLVTGATGFLGGHVLDALRVEHPDANLRVLVRNKNAWLRSATARRHADVEALEGALTAAPTLSDHPILGGLNAIVHLAALVRHSRHNAGEVYAVNVAGTGSIMALAQRTGARVVFVSTSGTVGCSLQSKDAPCEDAPYARATVGRWPYYDSKITAEIEARALAARHKLTLSILRPPAMLGPGDMLGRATGLVRKFLARKLPFLLRGGMHMADVRDVARAVARALAHPRVRPVYHLPGYAEPLSDFFGRLERLSHVPSPRRHLPYALAHAVARMTHDGGLRLVGRPLPPRLDPVMVEMGHHFWGLGSTHAHELDWQPRPLEDTLRATLADLHAL